MSKEDQRHQERKKQYDREYKERLAAINAAKKGGKKAYRVPKK